MTSISAWIFMSYSVTYFLPSKRFVSEEELKSTRDGTLLPIDVGKKRNVFLRILTSVVGLSFFSTAYK